MKPLAARSPDPTMMSMALAVDSTPDEEMAEPLRPVRTIVLATDGSRESRAARRVAADLARRADAGLHIVTAFQSEAAAAYLYPTGVNPTTLQERVADNAAAVLATERTAAERLGATVVEDHLAEGPAYEMIDSAADRCDADLIVVGSRHLGAISRILAGSVSSRVVRSAHRPVLVVREADAGWPPESIIVGFDHSPESLRAASLAARLTALYDETRMTLLRVVRRGDRIDGHPGSFGEMLAAEQDHMAHHAEILTAVAGRPVLAALVVDEPAQALVDAPLHHEGGVLLVVGTRGLGRLRRFMLGSVSARVLHAAQSSVLVVPGGAEAP